jgi:hypothetical protein
VSGRWVVVVRLAAYMQRTAWGWRGDFSRDFVLYREPFYAFAIAETGRRVWCVHVNVMHTYGWFRGLVGAAGGALGWGQSVDHGGMGWGATIVTVWDWIARSGKPETAPSPAPVRSRRGWWWRCTQHVARRAQNAFRFGPTIIV